MIKCVISTDQQLHAQVLQDDITEDLLSTLVLHSAPSQESVQDLMMKPCLKCLLLLTFSSPPLRDRIAQDATTLSTICRGTIRSGAISLVWPKGWGTLSIDTKCINSDKLLL